MIGAFSTWIPYAFVKGLLDREALNMWRIPRQEGSDPSVCFLTARGALAQDIQDGQVIALAVLFYAPAEDRLFIIALAGRTNPEVTGLLAKFNIHAGESELSR